jgi:hypothetical protein
VVDGTGLENRHTRKGIGGSNPSLSARYLAPLEIRAPPILYGYVRHAFAAAALVNVAVNWPTQASSIVPPIANPRSF